MPRLPEKPEPASCNIYALLDAKREAPLTDAEIRALRKLLADAEAILTTCPIARRAVSTR